MVHDSSSWLFLIQHPSKPCAPFFFSTAFPIELFNTYFSLFKKEKIRIY